ncbi:anhydro-N-acetylmuramic acid kinase [Leeuwenhoekiella sp. A2]|uniref:anhydro-N-acetylmuramic acid kinase n=1 Tax=Leeuwenhoekiella sp. A2 TaxID=3141460 RepID=UPI003A80EDB8|tara:strand:- start:6663 stop:7739 length:1077 start_codon:yes stop_codon:yes gene_type:complete
MQASDYYVIGIMSGTSVDGIDFAYAKFYKESSWHFELLITETVAYSQQWQQDLRDAINYNEADLKAFDDQYTKLLADVTHDFITRNKIVNSDAICSHGHTILHQPQNGRTYQIGNQQLLAQQTGYRVICDFRVQDVEKGGQGAPLVPIGDRFLFSEYDFCLNIGGFANISFEDNDERIAFDICPTNIVLNYYAQKTGLEYDKDGAIAAAHKADEVLLQKLNALPFYTAPFPKSLGLEWVKENIFPLIESSGLSSEIVIATFTEHMAQQIAAIFSLKAKSKEELKIIATGGGAFNKHLIRRIEILSQQKITIPQKQIVEFKEALIFGFMGVLRLRNMNNVLRSVTGAIEDHCSGKIFLT